MPDLRTNISRLNLLYEHIHQREGKVQHFYCDEGGLVTIGVGYLVDQANSPDSVGRSRARQLAVRPGIAFTRAIDGAVNITDIENDWQRVKDYGRAHSRAPARDYHGIAQLRLSEFSIRRLLEDQNQPKSVHRLCQQLYSSQPFLLHYDSRIAMAFVDVLFNPARVSLFGSDPRIQEMWETLGCSGGTVDWPRALILFEQIWDNRGTARYQERHRIRVQWFREGVQATATHVVNTIGTAFSFGLIPPPREIE